MLKKMLSFSRVMSLGLVLGLTIASCQKEEAPIINPPTPDPIPTVKSIDESFDGTKYDDVIIEGWSNIVVDGDQPYIYNEYSENTYANMSVYKAETSRETWLITPMLDVKEATHKSISFDTRADHIEGAIFEVYYSEDFDGDKDLSKFTWTKLDVKLSTAGPGDYGDWVNSGTVDLSTYGNCAIAFKYVGDPATKKGGYSIDNFKFNQVPVVPEEGKGTGTLADPYDVINAKVNQGDKDNGIMKWTMGYIVGFVETKDGDANNGKVVFGVSDHVNTNLVIANSADETDAAKTLVVQLPSGFVRDALNLVDNAGMLKTQVWLNGSLEAYFGMPGIKGVDSYSLDGTKIETAPVTGVIGAGDPIMGSDLTATAIDFTVWNVLQSEAIWKAASGTASVNGYGKGNTESWMISKTMLDFTAVADARLFVSENLNYFKGFNYVQVMISTDYSGTGDPSNSTWTELAAEGTRAENGDAVTQFIGSGTGYVAFKYTATAGKESSWTIKTVEVKAKEDNGGGTDPDPKGLVNGDFETWTDDTTPEGWTKAENTEKESAIIHGGTYSVKHTGGTKDIAQTFDIESGETYIVNFWYYKDNSTTGNGGRLWSFFKDSSGSSVGDIKGDEDYLSGANGTWHEFKKEYTATSDAVKIYFEFRTYSNSIVYYDDLTVTKK